MKKFLHYGIAGLILGMYFAVGVFGNTGEWINPLERQTEQHFTQSSATSLPLNSRPAWTEQKHTPVATRVTGWISEAPLAPNFTVYEQEFYLLLDSTAETPGCGFEIHYSSRAPPLS